MNNNWHNPENWNSDALVYNKKSDVLYFDSTAKYETAEYTVDVPDWANSFSLSFKAGNSRSATKEGAKDVGYIAVGTDSGVIAKTPMIKDNLTYVRYTLSAVPVQTEQLYITAEAYNSYGDEIDFYFGGFDIEFYETMPDSFNTEYYFLGKPTTESVQNINKKTSILPLAAAILLGIILIACFLLTRKEKHNETPESP
ncbi:MAG: hypothetical protein IJ385_00935 [Ruminiclostridium sp.]|nr:hypothetical protein [Ruminiclostridium sp.]